MSSSSKKKYSDVEQRMRVVKKAWNLMALDYAKITNLSTHVVNEKFFKLTIYN